ncbi:glycosyltransferase [Telmatospirillum sp.]|uniref:glycosyltransferase n=1 Tax=Telmatospirillum sp. TaxID=2079197 RepID=UPI002850E1B9|nr:glycosyltransferase [Telmatospirillum sp.]MDR3439073.1 glycosyltransferase [Telmatospirillum sp.]
MHITLVDDSIPFDGFTPTTRALGGAEKAFASLAGALVRRGHDVHVYNRARFPLLIEGAHWETMEKSFPTQTDVLIAFRKPSLLPAVRLAGKRLLWVTASARQLEPARKALDSFRPMLVFLGRTQMAAWRNVEGLTVRVVSPGVRQDFLADTPTELAAQPTAVVTTHPAHGLDWVLDRWALQIRPAVANARLVVVSTLLEKGKAGGELPDDMRALLEKATAIPGVEIVAPGGDSTMAALYRSARVHLYPGHPDDMACWTLMESQACGLPAVARPLGAIHERLRDGQTGQIVPDEDAFANVAIRLLTDDEMFWSMNRDACQMQRTPTWDAVASEFGSVFSMAAG